MMVLRRIRLPLRPMRPTFPSLLSRPLSSYISGSASHHIDATHARAIAHLLQSQPCELESHSTITVVINTWSASFANLDVAHKQAREQALLRNPSANHFITTTKLVSYHDSAVWMLLMTPVTLKK